MNKADNAEAKPSPQVTRGAIRLDFPAELPVLFPSAASSASVPVRIAVLKPRAVIMSARFQRGLSDPMEPQTGIFPEVSTKSLAICRFLLPSKVSSKSLR